jgi:hypothetical protein
MSDAKFYFWYGVISAGVVTIASLLDLWSNRRRRRSART